MLKDTIGLLIAVLLWSLSYIWTKGALDFLNPLLLVGMRVLVAVICLSIYALISGKVEKIKGKDIRALALLGIIEPVGYFLFETSGVDYVSPTLACIIIALIPIVTPVFSALTGGSPVSRREWVSLSVSLVGVMLVVAGDSEPIAGRLVGILLLLGAVATAVAHAIMVKNLSARLRPVTIVAWQYIFATLYLLPIVLTSQFDVIKSLEFNPGWFYNVLILGIFCSCISFVLYANAIHKLGIMKTSMYVNLMPSMTAIASVLILGESLSALKIAGIIVTIGGLMILKEKKAAH